MKTILDYQVPKNNLALWWFGQNGFIFKSPEGTLAGVDLYLTDSCATLAPEVGLDLHRQVPVLITPEDLQLDVFACTHNHQDHTDPDTIRALRHKDTMQFVGPGPSCGVYRQESVEEGRIVQTWPDSEVEHNDLRLKGTFAVPTDATDLNHMGFVLQFGNGPKVYITGDTDYHELLGSAAKHSPDIVITCINGGYNNLSHFEAAQLCSIVKPKVAIGCHYDMFADNSVDPRMFRASLKIKAPDVKYQQLTHGDPFLFAF